MAVKPLVMGVLNVTPDSFSDGGRWFDPSAAIARGLEMAAEGADVVDVGGESTRPGAEPVDAAEERRRAVLFILGLLALTVMRHVVVSRADNAALELVGTLATMTYLFGGLVWLRRRPKKPD